MMILLLATRGNRHRFAVVAQGNGIEQGAGIDLSIGMIVP
jgi:hypothetical protein